MAADVAASVRQSLSRLQKEIAKKESELAGLKAEVQRLQRVEAILRGNKRGRKPERRRGKRLDWNKVFASLPNSFTVAELAKANGARSKSRAYLQQLLARWSKQKRIKRVGRGSYQKLASKQPKK